MSENLTLWSSVERTPPSETKEITGKSYKGNSPKPHYLVKKATETFGPCGIGWGFEILDERVEPGPGDERMHVARVRVWYDWQGKRGQVEHIGGTPFAGMRASGKPFMDEDAPKKSVTDALVKALSMIGFAGDIFLGRYDDSRYMSELRQEEHQEKAGPRAVQDAPPRPSADAQAMAESIRDCHSQRDLDFLAGSAEFTGFYDAANAVDKRHLRDAKAAWIDRHGKAEAA